MQRDYFVYILASKSRRLYIGMTSDLERRVYEHKHGLTPGFTSTYRINRLVHVEVFSHVDDAMRREVGTVEEAETMTAAEMLRAMDLYRQLSGRPLVDTPATPPAETESPATPQVAPAPAEADKPAAGDATVTPLDVTRKR